MSETYTGYVDTWGLPEGTILECTNSDSRAFVKGRKYRLIEVGRKLHIEDEVNTCTSVCSSFKVFTNDKVTSDGGSSSYYTLQINNNKVETEDIIRDVFNNDFDFGNAFKSLVRAYLNTQGAGKAGNDLEYELNKIRYSLDKIRKQQ